MFYAIGHFSKFLPEDSVILTTTLTESSIHIRESVSAVAALRPDGHTTLVLLNKYKIIILGVLQNFNIKYFFVEIEIQQSLMSKTRMALICQSLYQLNHLQLSFFK